MYSKSLQNKFLILVAVSVHLRFWSLSRPRLSIWAPSLHIQMSEALWETLFHIPYLHNYDQ